MRESIYTYELCDILFSLGPFSIVSALAEAAIHRDMDDGELF